jgi:hypothetical protein
MPAATTEAASRGFVVVREQLHEVANERAIGQTDQNRRAEARLSQGDTRWGQRERRMTVPHSEHSSNG